MNSMKLLDQRGVTSILIVLGAIVLLTSTAYFAFTNGKVPAPVITPTPTPSNERAVSEGERVGSFLVEHIYSNYITGLNYREYPIATNQGQTISLKIGESASNGCTITVTLKGISEKTAYFTVVEDNNRPCPICLSQDTKIDMISGQVMVQDVKVGDKVWSIDEKGKSFIATVIMLGKTQVPSTHVVTHITLAGKRNVTASPNHPTIDGRTVGDLNVGDILDGSKIIKVETLPYKYAYTYDILTSGETGTYFAGGIPLGSTLSK